MTRIHLCIYDPAVNRLKDIRTGVRYESATRPLQVRPGSGADDNKGQFIAP